ncbi:bifunctional acetate--CoA ligase family protein/GNAT family N-acetyltransferase [Arthrobacter agilis]|uniref:bifunctional acetate--CoA ligase family protein/GNAT family N-acetyltransferase n=1 Tax=Arthrobacter agilis TaxID=37921 RepID=UPI002788D5E1|nr:bifunctional GNAT family N-acetyltransferase/acetate--CoA ligase family protein [Arthrobacter agilis]MDQ0734402.1 acyl-CoA synthetase (NDP forming)/RimJ/RimL family protein N-acetyltransferase [Arthrobacter agilis]
MATDGQYPEYWEADVVLRDGGTGHLRPISPSDADAVQAFHVRQSQNSIYLRFFTYKAKLSAKELKRFTEVDHRDRVAFVITRGADIIGIGRYDRLDDPLEAEVAFNVSDHHQGRGVGSILLEHLAAAARENGIRRFSAEVLPENRKMITVFAEAGYEVERHFDDGVVMLSFDIDPTRKSQAVMESREHRAEARSMAELLTPSSVAVIGASREWGTVGYALLEHLIDGGFTGRVYAVNPEAFELHGMISHASLAEVPEPVDLAVVAVPHDQVDAVVDECARAGVRGLLVATAGYADDGDEGLARQRALVHKARAHGMRVVGPASLGLVNTDPAVRLNASMAPELPRRGALSLFSQSAGLGVLLYASAHRRGLGVSSVISAGNRADVSGNDAMQFWEDDPTTRAVGLYFESIGNPRKFSRIARRLARTKPVIVAKSDVTGLQLPPGHAVRTTQAPPGALDSMLRQSGVMRVETTEQLMDIAQIVASQPLPLGTGVAVFSNSSALGKVVADGVVSQGMTVARLETGLQLDTGRSVALRALAEAVEDALRAESVHAAIITTLPARGLTADAAAACLQACAERAGKPVVASFTGILDARLQLDGLVSAPASGARAGEATGGTLAAPLEGGAATPDGEGAAGPAERETAAAVLPLQRGLPCFPSPGAALAALGAVVRYAQWRARDHGEFLDPDGVDVDGAARVLGQVRARVADIELTRLTPEECSALMGAYGIRLLPSARFSSVDEAVEQAGRLGWPVALKTMDEHLRHRLDLGGVRLNIDDAESLRRNITRMEKVLAPFGRFGMEVQSMAPSGQACSIRAIEDPLMGPVISFGLAGDSVNLLDDWAHAVPPLSTGDVTDLVRAPRASRKLFGYQGLPPVDVAAVEDLVARVALLKDNHPEIARLDFTPVLVASSGLTVLSAAIDVGNPQRRTDSARRAMRD